MHPVPRADYGESRLSIPPSASTASDPTRRPPLPPPFASDFASQQEPLILRRAGLPISLRTASVAFLAGLGLFTAVRTLIGPVSHFWRSPFSPAVPASVATVGAPPVSAEADSATAAVNERSRLQFVRPDQLISAGRRRLAD